MGGVVAVGEVPDGFAREIRDRIFGAREQRYEREVTADRFDGTGNVDHSEGAEIALRLLANHYGVPEPDEKETQAEAIRRLRSRIARHWGNGPVDPGSTEAAVLEHLGHVEAGVPFG